MPQNKRKKPFSAKQKRDQLQKKRERQRDKKSAQDDDLTRRVLKEHGSSSDDESQPSRAATVAVSKLHQQPAVQRGAKTYDPNRYRLHFAQETAVEIEQRKEEARHPFERLPETALEVRYEDVYQPGSVLDMPCRPSWNFSMSKEQLERKEATYFRRYLEKVFEAHEPSQLSYFEQNLETWRQLWRVLEMSSIVVLIADIRHPILHFPPTLYKHVVEEQKKQLVLVLNKVDLVPASVVVAWCEYFGELYPNLHIIPYTARPGASLAQGAAGLLSRRRGRRGQMMCVAGAQQLMRAVAELYRNEDVLVGWREKVQRACETDGKEGDSDEDDDVLSPPSDQADNSSSYLLTIGLVGCELFKNTWTHQTFPDNSSQRAHSPLRLTWARVSISCREATADPCRDVSDFTSP